MSEFKEIKTQEEFDTAIKERLARENKKYEGFVSPDKLAELKADYEKEISKKENKNVTLKVSIDP